jgi:hypothetical protein
MASIIWNLGEQSLIDTWLNGDTTKVPAVAGNWGVGMGAMSGAIQGNNDKTKTNGSTTSTIGEIGQTTTGGYSRRPITRDNSGWPLSSLNTGSYQSQATQVTFSFSGTPNLNGATLWFVAKTTSIGASDCYFGADLAATRNFTNGDTEKITVTYRQT